MNNCCGFIIANHCNLIPNYNLKTYVRIHIIICEIKKFQVQTFIHKFLTQSLLFILNNNYTILIKT